MSTSRPVSAIATKFLYLGLNHKLNCHKARWHPVLGIILDIQCGLPLQRMRVLCVDYIQLNFQCLLPFNMGFKALGVAIQHVSNALGFTEQNIVLCVL